MMGSWKTSALSLLQSITWDPIFTIFPESTTTAQTSPSSSSPSATSGSSGATPDASIPIGDTTSGGGGTSAGASGSAGSQQSPVPLGVIIGVSTGAVVVGGGVITLIVLLTRRHRLKNSIRRVDLIRQQSEEQTVALHRTLSQVAIEGTRGTSGSGTSIDTSAVSLCSNVNPSSVPPADNA